MAVFVANYWTIYVTFNLKFHTFKIYTLNTYWHDFTGLLEIIHMNIV